MKKVDKEIEQHPERFDYQDVPGKPGAAYRKQIERNMPQDLKDELANVGNKG